MCTEEYCKWQINAPYNINRNNEMTVGPFPGDLAKTSFMSFDYKAIDVLCLEKMIVSGNGMTIDILEVKLRSTKIYSQKIHCPTKISIYRRMIFNVSEGQ